MFESQTIAVSLDQFRVIEELGSGGIIYLKTFIHLHAIYCFCLFVGQVLAGFFWFRKSVA